MSSESAAAEASGRLMGLVRAELANIPVQHWGFFFPCHVAVWRFIEWARPGVLGEVKALFKDEPVFEGRGATWFCEALGSHEEYVNLLEEVMYPITRDAPSAILDAVRRRGFFRDEEIPSIDPSLVQRLADVVLAFVDQARIAGQIR